MYRVFLKASARKALNQLPLKAQKSVVHALDELARLGIHAQHTKKLQPPIGGYRTRVGEHRILFDNNKELIIVHRISKRADAYR